MLEDQTSQLVAGLQELYRRCESKQGWAGPRIRRTARGNPAIHDILELLGVLNPDYCFSKQNSQHGPSGTGWNFFDGSSTSEESTRPSQNCSDTTSFNSSPETWPSQDFTSIGSVDLSDEILDIGLPQSLRGESFSTLSGQENDPTCDNLLSADAFWRPTMENISLAQVCEPGAPLYSYMSGLEPWSQANVWFGFQSRDLSS